MTEHVILYHGKDENSLEISVTTFPDFNLSILWDGIFDLKNFLDFLKLIEFNGDETIFRSFSGGSFRGRNYNLGYYNSENGYYVIKVAEYWPPEEKTNDINIYAILEDI